MNKKFAGYNLRNKPDEESVDRAMEKKNKLKKEKKESQKELTQALLNAYSAIKPTIIQAQRILKIIDRLCEEIMICRYLNYRFVKHFKDDESLKASGLELDLVDQLSPNSILKNLGSLAEKLQEIIELRGGREDQSISDEQEVSEGSDSQENDDDGASDDEDNKRKEEEENSMKIQAIQVEVAKVFRTLVADLLYKKKDYEVLKRQNTNYNDSEMYNDVLDCLTSLRAIYLKKLSTAHDEEVTSAKMLEDYKKKVSFIMTNNFRSKTIKRSKS